MDYAQTPEFTEPREAGVYEKPEDTQALVDTGENDVEEDETPEAAHRASEDLEDQTDSFRH